LPAEATVAVSVSGPAPDVCVVTGATRGIGAAIVARLRRDGFEVVGVARSRPSDWAGRFVECDLADRASLRAACAHLAGIERVWALVNNAGVTAADSVETLSRECLEHAFAMNTVAPALLAAATVPRMTAGGRIVNVSTATEQGRPNRSAYSASKSALSGLTRTRSLELVERGITVNSVAPGAIATEMLAAKFPPGSAQETALSASVPMRRMGAPDEVAELVGYFVGRGSGYTTGQTVYVDGGASVGAGKASPTS
jgi:NAD(P)-dependent dehydrogenase (short-subunit alcohol dehydrogenase family)